MTSFHCRFSLCCCRVTDPSEWTSAVKPGNIISSGKRTGQRPEGESAFPVIIIVGRESYCNREPKLEWYYPINTKDRIDMYYSNISSSSPSLLPTTTKLVPAEEELWSDRASPRMTGTVSIEQRS